MASPASVAKHPLHPMLIVFPIGLWVFSLISDVLYRVTGGENWLFVAFYTMLGGLIGALVAAIPGFVDYLSIRNEQIKATATWHMVINLGLVFLYGINLWLRTSQGHTAVLPFALSVLGTLLLIVSGWLGGHLVYVHAVAVETPSQGGRGRG